MHDICLLPAFTALSKVWYNCCLSCKTVMALLKSLTEILKQHQASLRSALLVFGHTFMHFPFGLPLYQRAAHHFSSDPQGSALSKFFNQIRCLSKKLKRWHTGCEGATTQNLRWVATSIILVNIWLKATVTQGATLHIEQSCEPLLNYISLLLQVSAC